MTSQDHGSPGPNPTIPYQELRRLIALDTEVAPQSRQMRAIAAYRPDIDEKTLITGTQHRQDSALAQLNAAAKGASFVLGHNIIGHDLPHLRHYSPQLDILTMPVVDTLHLTPRLSQGTPTTTWSSTTRTGT